MYVHEITLYVINPRRACATRVTVVGSVCLSVRLSVKPHLTSGASVRPENAVTYSASNEGQNIRGVFSETAPLRRSSTSCIVRLSVQSGIFTRQITRMHIIRPRLACASMYRRVAIAKLFCLRQLCRHSTSKTAEHV